MSFQQAKLVESQQAKMLGKNCLGQASFEHVIFQTLFPILTKNSFYIASSL